MNRNIDLSKFNSTIEGTIFDLNLENYVEDSQLEGLLENLDCIVSIEIKDETPVCPLCGSFDIIVEGRCFTCLDCGWSKCSL